VKASNLTQKNLVHAFKPISAKFSFNYYNEIGWDGVDWVDLARIGTIGGLL
jgi:hypothetical protein